MTYNVFGGTLNLAQFNSIQFNSVSDSRVYNPNSEPNPTKLTNPNPI